MQYKPFVTIIIPTLNEEVFIRQCLSSAYAQSYPQERIEILVLDGGSQDNTLKIVREEQLNHPNLSVLRNPGKIQSAAFNQGVGVSKGEIIIRWDAHCKYDPDYVYHCVKNHQEGIFGNVGGSIQVLPGSESLMSRTIALINTLAFGTGGAAFRSAPAGKYVDTVPYGSFRREIIEKIGPMNENLKRGEDNEYNARIRNAGYKILLDPEIKSCYYARKDLRSFLKQMGSNGYSIGILLRMSVKYTGLRHTVPLLFFLFIATGLILFPFFLYARIIFLFILALYFLLSLAFAVMAGIGNDFRIIPLMVFSVFCVHLCYGYCTLKGLIQWRPAKK